MLASPDQQISLTDPDSRSMATSGRGSGVVGYNVQVAVDTEHHLIVTHEVTNTPHPGPACDGEENEEWIDREPMTDEGRRDDLPLGSPRWRRATRREGGWRRSLP
jgi:hypothetical protein